MALIEVTPLADLSEAAPAGENLEYDPDFGAMERAAQGKLETQFEPAVAPDWKEVESVASGLLDRTRDVRVMAYLATARLHRSGIPAFAEVLAQTRLLLETRWDTVQPQLDPEDDNDPTSRSTALLRLADPIHVLRRLRDIPLATSPRTGPVTWREVALFQGATEPEPGQEKPTEAFIRGAFSEANPERQALLREAIDLALESADGISSALMDIFSARGDSGSAPDFAPLLKLLTDFQKIFTQFTPLASAAAGPEAEDGAGGAAPPEAAGDIDPGAPRAVRGAFDIRSITSIGKRDDALYLLDLASAFFRTHEPSSPLPMLIDRALRLSAMGFMDILRDLAPDGLNQAQAVAGPLPE